jgi:hypothetical protein
MCAKLKWSNEEYSLALRLQLVCGHPARKDKETAVLLNMLWIRCRWRRKKASLARHWRTMMTRSNRCEGVIWRQRICFVLMSSLWWMVPFTRKLKWLSTNWHGWPNPASTMPHAPGTKTRLMDKVRGPLGTLSGLLGLSSKSPLKSLSQLGKKEPQRCLSWWTRSWRVCSFCGEIEFGCSAINWESRCSIDYMCVHVEMFCLAQAVAWCRWSQNVLSYCLSWSFTHLL